MGVDRTDYIVFGWKLPYIEGHKGIDHIIVYDGMSGEYTVFGKLIAQADDMGDGWGFKDLDLKDIDPEPIKAMLIALFQFDAIPSEPKLFIFSHYS